MTKNFNQPTGGNEMPRFAGIASMFRLPVVQDASGLDVAIVGVPLDIGTSNRVGTRYGPRQIRTESVLVRPYGMATGAAPFDSFQVADTGDVALNTFNLTKSIAIIEEHYDHLLKHDVIPVTVGGDHTITLPILRALYRIHGPMAWFTSMHMRISMMRCSASASRMAPSSDGLSKRAWSWRRK